MPVLMVGHGENGHQIQRANTNKLWLIVNVEKYRLAPSIICQSQHNCSYATE